MNVILLGPPGAGKGTQAKGVAQRLGLRHVSTGDLLRKSVEERTDLGRKARSYLAAGALVPDEIMIGLMEKALGEAEDFVLDGFPRTIDQATALDRFLAGRSRRIDRVLSLTVSEKEVLRRLSGRRQCGQGHVYNLGPEAPKEKEACDICGGALRQRADDAEETVRRRLAVYAALTAPLLEYYKARGILRTVAGEGPADRVARGVEAELSS